MSPLLMTPHVTERCCAADPAHRVPLKALAAPISLPFPYDTTLQTTLPLRTAPIKSVCPFTNGTTPETKSPI
jgi:hypothetical protein